MSVALRRLLRGLAATAAETAPDAEDPGLRGRTYAIPFDRVWRAALALAEGGLPRWRLLHADDHDGVIRAETTGTLVRGVADVTIRIALDADAQTRVDASAALREGRRDFGSSARRLARFFRALDRSLERGGLPATVRAAVR